MPTGRCRCHQRIGRRLESQVIKLGPGDRQPGAAPGGLTPRDTHQQLVQPCQRGLRRRPAPASAPTRSADSASSPAERQEPSAPYDHPLEAALCRHPPIRGDTGGGLVLRRNSADLVGPCALAEEQAEPATALVLLRPSNLTRANRT